MRVMHVKHDLLPTWLKVSIELRLDRYYMAKQKAGETELPVSPAVGMGLV